MKYYLLKSLVNYLQKFQYVHYIKRVDNNIIKIEFTKDEIFYFDLTKGNSSVFIKPNNSNIKKDFIAPFDIVLQKKFTNANISKIYLLNNDKILNIDIFPKSSYKKELIKLQLEFTGKNTNIIVLNQENIILEALRHIDYTKSSRIVKVGHKLEPLPNNTFKFENKQCDNIIEILKNNFQQQEVLLLNNLKKQKLQQIKKQIDKINKILNQLDSIEVLENKSIQYYNKANLLLSNSYKIKPYDTKVEIINLQGETEIITLDTTFGNINQYINHLFKIAKKYKQKAQNQHLEYNNLEEKLKFYNKLITIIHNATTIDEIEFYLPKKDKKQTKTKKSQPYQSFFIDGYKIILGRTQRENIYLLQNSKASDFWFHLQNQVSAHVIVVNSKKTIPNHIIEEAAKLCAKFSTSSKGTYKVDFTQRRNVKIQSGANVLYNPYSTIEIKL